MDGGVVRSLVLACSLLLTWPQGWCCLFACQTTTTVSAARTGSDDVPDGGCCPHKSKPSSASTERPTPGEKSPDPTGTTCCCADQHALPPAVSSVEPVDTGIVLFLPPPASAVPGPGYRAAATGADIPPPVIPLHILNCVWLC